MLLLLIAALHANTRPISIAKIRNVEDLLTNIISNINSCVSSMERAVNNNNRVINALSGYNPKGRRNTTPTESVNLNKMKEFAEINGIKYYIDKYGRIFYDFKQGNEAWNKEAY